MISGEKRIQPAVLHEKKNVKIFSMILKKNELGLRLLWFKSWIFNKMKKLIGPLTVY